MIYLDSASTALLRPPEVGEAVGEAIRSLASASRGSYPAASDAARLVHDTRSLLAELFGAAGPECVAFTANATAALNIVLKGLLEKGDAVLTTVLEHNSVLRPLYELEEKGIKTYILAADSQGMPDYGQIEQMLKNKPRIAAVVTTHASNLTGNLVDLARLGRLCEKYHRLLLVDVSQTAGVFPIHMERQHIDALCFSGHKWLFGPQGTGGICVRPGLSIRALLSGDSRIQPFERQHPAVMPEHLEAGSLNVHALAGLRAGLRYIQSVGLDNLRQSELGLARRFYEMVRNLVGVRIYGNFMTELRIPIVSLNIQDNPSGLVSDMLSVEYDICTRPGGHSAPLMHKHFGTERQGMVRFSFSYFNTMQEVERAVVAVRHMAARM